MDLRYYMPLALIIAANLLYHTTAKNTPVEANPFFALLVTYAVSFLTMLVCYFVGGMAVSRDLSHISWTSFGMGLAVVGVELGYILLYREGWPIGTAALIATSGIAAVLLLVGSFLYHEALSIKQLAGIVLCLTGIALIKG